MQEIEIAQQGILALARHLYEQGRITSYFGPVSSTDLDEGKTEDEEEWEGEEYAEDEEEEEEEH